MVDSFLRLLFLSREQKLSDLIGNFQCFEALFATHSEQTQMFFPKAFIENFQCQEVKSIPWKDGTTLITFGSPHSLYTPKQIVEKVKEQQIKQMNFINRLSGTEAAYNQFRTHHVTVQILEIDWLGSNLESFFPFLSTLKFHEFDNALLKVILE